MNVKEVLAELKDFGNESTKKTLMKHGAKEPFYGVKIADLKKVLKKIKGDQDLALKLYETGNSDAMYLAGLAADGGQMTKGKLRDWAKAAYWTYLSEYTVPWVASESKHGWDLSLEWIDSKKENIASAGWASLGSIVMTSPNEDLDLKALGKLLKRVEKDIQSSQNRVRYTMNGFVIAVGSYVKPLSQEAVKTAKKIGTVEVEMGGTACKVPFAPEYIKKAKARGSLDKKKKTAKC
ncbi:MAG: DNA alkylation repair protein [Pyrinomonadaceae bacterium]|nr:DNA alkylation repair protein [Pyrinomonadaceae bacterium]